MVTLRKITEADAPLLVAWRNENAEFFPPQPPLTIGSHLAWFRDVYQHDPSASMFMVEHEGRPVGCVSMTIRDGRGELAQMILGDKTLARGGLMRAASRQLMDAYGLAAYWLRVLPGNTVTISFHKRNGFEVTGETGGYLIMERTSRPWGGA
jgi:RimJ/RimL family protein N-acetyltransferase